MIEIADNHMRENRPRDALKAYQDAWGQLQRKYDSTQRVWLLLSIANAAVRSGDFEEAFAALSVLPERYAETGVVVGNPLFHLLVGLSYHGVNDDPEGETDNFARALICGGQEIFAGEAPRTLATNKGDFAASRRNRHMGWLRWLFGRPPERCEWLPSRVDYCEVRGTASVFMNERANKAVNRSRRSRDL